MRLPMPIRPRADKVMCSEDATLNNRLDVGGFVELGLLPLERLTLSEVPLRLHARCPFSAHGRQPPPIIPRSTSRWSICRRGHPARHRSPAPLFLSFTTRSALSSALCVLCG